VLEEYKTKAGENKIVYRWVGRMKGGSRATYPIGGLRTSQLVKQRHQI